MAKERGDPLRLVREASRRRDEAARIATRDGDVNLRYDSVWCVCDVDEHARLAETVRFAARSHINMAISNPCFELWPALHFDGCRKHVTAARLKTILRGKMKGYEKSLDCTQLNGLRGTALRNAAALDDWHARNGSAPGSNPSTGVWRLVERLEGGAGSPAVR
ncbi:RloB family protein [Paractinoplanes rhizophilus]|uniref:RloB family protein n=1 Tax=Paractinoplanes rhizophilus TaxID=1416877 RepID=A0ABW2HXZ0_9ACTN